MKRVALFCVLIVLSALSIGMLSSSDTPTTRISATLIPVLSTKAGAVMHFESIFIGTVGQEMMTLQYNETGDPLPYTYFKVSVITILKGPAESDIIIEYYGGVQNDGVKILIGGQEMPKTASTYLFLVNRRRDTNNPEITRTTGNVYPVTSEVSMKLLDGYDASQTVDRQSRSIENILQEYRTLISTTAETNQLAMKSTENTNVTIKRTGSGKKDDVIVPMSYDCILFPELCQIDLGGHSFIYAQNLGIGMTYASAIEVIGDVDYYRITSAYTNWIRIYSKGTIDVKAYLYKSPNTTSYFDVNNDISELDNTDDPFSGNLLDRALLYTNGTNFYFELYAEAGETYYVKVQSSLYSSTGNYSITAEENCFCAHEVTDYTNFWVTDSVPNNLIVNYTFDETNYEAQTMTAISMWDDIGVINFEPDTIYTTNDLEFHTYYNQSSAAMGYYIHPVYVGRVYLNTFHLDGLAFDIIVSVAEHEIGHALDFGEMYNNGVSIELWRNAMTAGGHNDARLGPCDLAVYHEMWGE